MSAFCIILVEFLGKFKTVISLNAFNIKVRICTYSRIYLRNDELAYTFHSSSFKLYFSFN